MPIRMTLNPGFPPYAARLLELAQAEALSERCDRHPRSGSRSGTALLLADGTEARSPSLPPGVCAESAALTMVTIRPGDLRVIATVGGRSETAAGPVHTPCGTCRQLLWDLSAHVRDLEVYCADLALRTIVLVTVGELLPWPPRSDQSDDA